MRVKLGLDPTASDVTLGWAVVLHKLRQFQDAGHVAVLIVGDFTARVGDPSGKSETRPRLDKDVVKAYADRLLEQFGRILSNERLEVRYNSEWLERMDMEAVLRLTSSYTVARMLERDDFAARYADGRPISIMEFMYPLLQGYDSVAVEADIELGGTDQLFNLLVGRELQRSWDQEPQVAMTVPLLEGLDGVQKMSQSLGNYVGITEPARRDVRQADADPRRAHREVPAVGGVAAGRRGRGRRVGPRGRVVERERREAGHGATVVEVYHGPGAGAEAEEAFNRVHRDRELPEVVQDVPIPDGATEDGVVWLPRLLVALDLASSNGDARRRIEQGGVRLDDEPVTDPSYEARREELAGKVLQVGRRWFGRLA